MCSFSSQLGGYREHGIVCCKAIFKNKKVISFRNSAKLYEHTSVLKFFVTFFC